MNKRIIYQTQEGGLAVIIPAHGPDCDCDLTLEQIAAKDVPAGVPYQIVDVADIPEDRTFRDAWEVDITQPDGIGAAYGVGTNMAVIGWNDDGTPITQEIN